MKIKLLGSLAIVLGVFLFAGVAAAADADVLQPASDITYNENVDINGSLNVDSLRVGTAGLGGVTFFNGTVLNEGADPFTVGDDMRVDGEIWRVEKGGDNPIKISDNMVPTLTNTNDFGSSTNRWKKVYTKNLSISGDIIPVTQPGWNRSDSSIGSESKKIKKVWTDGADIRQLSSQQIFFSGGHAINSTGDQLSIEGNPDISLFAPGNKVIINDNTRLKFSTYHTSSYTCNSSHEGEVYYDTSGADHRLKICDYRSSVYAWRNL